MEERFWAKVDKTSDPQGCWLWTGFKDRCGYGNFRINSKIEKTHRVAYTLLGNTIPEGLHLAHSEHCVGKRHCCNPEHLTPKTAKENRMDMHRDGTIPCKLTAEQVLDIRSRVGQSCQELANEFGVYKSTISKILLRKTWAHI